MKNLLKNKKTIILIALAALCIISIIFIVSSANKNTTHPQNTPQTSAIASWNDLIPGVSSQENVVNELGQPKAVDGNTLLFNSKSVTKDNQVVIEGGTAVFFKVDIAPTEKRTSDEIASKYGVAQKTLYGPDSVNGFYLFVYPSNGIAYVGNPNTKDITEIWYFKPTTINDFMDKWAEDYFLTPLDRQF